MALPSSRQKPHPGLRTTKHTLPCFPDTLDRTSEAILALTRSSVTVVPSLSNERGMSLEPLMSVDFIEDDNFMLSGTKVDMAMAQVFALAEVAVTTGLEINATEEPSAIAVVNKLMPLLLRRTNKPMLW